MDKKWSLNRMRIISVQRNTQLLLFTALMLISCVAKGQLYSGQKGKVKLRGDAPQEIITAESASLVGKLDATSKRFNFKQPLNAFTFSQGDLQKKHAEESYFEIKQFPFASFLGEIINDISFEKNGVYNVTVKGKFSIHGIERDLKIPAVITLEDGKITIEAKFAIYLSDYNIKIPRLVSLKVSQEFAVDLTLKMTKANL
jgi:hypothetical protein